MSTRTFRLADGSRVVAAIYYGTVQIGGLPAVPADITTVGDEALLGRGVTDRFHLIFDHGRTLTAEHRSEVRLGCRARRGVME